MSRKGSPAPQDEVAFIKSHLATLASSRTSYPNDFVPPLEELPRRPPVFPIDVLPPPQRKDTGALSMDSFKITIKSLKPAVSFDLGVSPTDPISAVKQRLSEEPRAPPAEGQRLLLKGKVLADGKFVKEYEMAEGATVILMVKPGVEWTGEEKKKPDLHLDLGPAPALSAPSPPREAPSDVPIPTLTLTADNSDNQLGSPMEVDIDAAIIGPPLGPGPQPTSAVYHATLSSTEFWIRLHAFLKMQFNTESDADACLENWLMASKAFLSVGEIAKVRDAVGVVGMGGS